VYWCSPITVEVAHCLVVVGEDVDRRRTTCQVLTASGFQAFGRSSSTLTDASLDAAAIVLLDVSSLAPDATTAAVARIRAAAAGRCHVVLFGDGAADVVSRADGGRSVVVPWTPDGGTLVAFLRSLLARRGREDPSRGSTSNDARPTRVPSRPSLPSVPRRRVLVIDESELTLELTQARLNRAGFDVRIAMSLAELAPLATSFGPHVVVVNVQRPEILHGEPAAGLRKIAGHAALLLASSMPDGYLSELAARVGADGWVSKRHGLERFVEQLETQARTLAVLGASRARRTQELPG
jgi:CheY-like chemotaxis protein